MSATPRACKDKAPFTRKKGPISFEDVFEVYDTRVISGMVAIEVPAVVGAQKTTQA